MMGEGKKKIKIRRLWRINPKTKIKESLKIYKRSKEKAVLEKLLDEEMI